MYKQGDNEYTLKGSYLEVKHYYGDLTRKLAIKQTEYLGDADFDLCDKYQKDIALFEKNITEINEAIELNPDKANEIKEKRNYENLLKNYEACKTDYLNDRKAQRQKELKQSLYSNALMDILSDEKYVMSILPFILNGDVSKLTYDIVFAVAVLTDFFTFANQNNPLLKKYKGGMQVS